MSDLASALRDVGRLAMDSAPIIYFIEANPRYDAVVAATFERIARGDIVGVTSTVTLAEVLVHPLRTGRGDLVDAYSSLLLHSCGFTVAPVTAEVALQAALLRATYAMRTPEALQLATAMVRGCDAFLTNDAALARVAEVRVVVLDDLAQ